MFVVFAAHVHVFPINSDPPHVTSRAMQAPLFSHATLKRLGEPGDEAIERMFTMETEQSHFVFLVNCGSVFY